MPLKTTKATAVAKDSNAGDSNKSDSNVVLVGPNKDLDPASPEGVQWLADENARLAQEEQKRKDDEETERKRLAQEELDLEARRQEQERKDEEERQDAARKEREKKALEEAEAAGLVEAAKDAELGKGSPKPGRYASVKSRLRDPISGKTFLVGQSTIIKKADITKWFVKQLEASLLTPFDEAEEDEE